MTQVIKACTILSPENKLAITDFDSIPVSTYSYVVRSNIYLNTEMIHATIPIGGGDGATHSYIKYIKYTGPVSKKTIHNTEVQYRGATIKKTPNMLHACTLQYVLPEKIINAKLYNTGTMMITGCKTPEQCCQTVYGIYNIINTYCPQGIFYKSSSESRAIFRIEMVMKNIHFNIGFKVRRQKFAEYYSAALSDDLGYIITYDDQTSAGLNLKKIISGESQDSVCELIISADSEKGYLVANKHVPVKYKPSKSITFIIFYSGNCRYSGCNNDVMKRVYYEFVNMMYENKNAYEDTTPYLKLATPRNAKRPSIQASLVANPVASGQTKKKKRIRNKSHKKNEDISQVFKEMCKYYGFMQ